MQNERSKSSLKTLLNIYAIGAEDSNQKKLQIQELLNHYDECSPDNKREVVEIMLDTFIHVPSGIFSLE